MVLEISSAIWGGEPSYRIPK